MCSDMNTRVVTEVSDGGSVLRLMEWWMRMSPGSCVQFPSPSREESLLLCFYGRILGKSFLFVFSWEAS